ncbi:hypothetical protein Tco_0317256 [Tanacetum coccineum]
MYSRQKTFQWKDMGENIMKVIKEDYFSDGNGLKMLLLEEPRGGISTRSSTVLGVLNNFRAEGKESIEDDSGRFEFKQGQNRGGIINPVPSETPSSVTTVTDRAHSTRMSKANSDFKIQNTSRTRCETGYQRRCNVVISPENDLALNFGPSISFNAKQRACFTSDYVQTKVLAPGMMLKDSTDEASRSKPRSNTKKNWILPAMKVYMKEVEILVINGDPQERNYLRKLDGGSHWRPTGKKFALRRNMPVVQVMLWYLDSGCSKHMTGNRSKAYGILWKSYRAVRFGNDHLGGHFVILFLKGPFRNILAFVHDCKGKISLKGSREEHYLYTISIDEMMKSSRYACCPKLPSPNHGCGIVV